MARKILVEVIGDVSSLQRAYAKGEASTAAFGASVSAQNKHLLQFSRGALVGSGALAGLTRAVVFASSAFVGAYGLSFALKTSSDAAKEFQGQMELISTQAGATQKEVTKMSKAILSIAPSVGQTPTDLAKGLYHLESAGIRGTDALKALKAAAEGAAVGQADLESTVNALVGSYKSGISGLGSFSHAVATLSAVVGAGNIRMNDLNEALGTGILPAARAFGLTFQDVGAALATLSVGSVPVVEAATRLRMSFSLLSAGSVKADKALAGIGLSTKQLAVDMRQGGLPQAIGDLKSHLEKLSPVDQVRVLQKAFGGGRFSTSIITLVQNFDLLRKSMARVNAGVDKFGSSFEHTRHTAEFASKKFHAATQVLAVELGATLLPEITKTETAFGDWIDKMNKTGRLQKDIKAGAHDVSIVVHGLGDAFHLAEGPIVSFTDALGGVGKTLRDLIIVFAAFKLKGAGFFTAAANQAAIGRAALAGGIGSKIPGVGGAAGEAAAAAVEGGGGTDYVKSLEQLALVAEARDLFPQGSMIPTKGFKSKIPSRLSRAGTTVYSPGGPMVLGGAQEAKSAEATYAAAVKVGEGTTNAVMELDKGASALTNVMVTAAEKQSAAIEQMLIKNSMQFGGAQGLRTAGGTLPSGKVVPGGRFAGTVAPAFFTGGEGYRLQKKTGEVATNFEKVSKAAVSFGKTLGSSLSTVTSWAARNSTTAGLGLAFLGPQAAKYAGLPGGVGSLLGGAGFGLFAGGLLPGRYSAGIGTAIGAGVALHSQGGQLGRTAGDIITGAGAGAMLGQVGGPMGIGIGAAVGGLAGAFLSLRHHTESASAALERLSKSMPSLREKVAEARTGLAEAKGQLQIDRFTRDQALHTRNQARAVEIATRGTKNHKVAVDALNAAQAQYDGTLRQIEADEKSIVEWQRKLGGARGGVVRRNKDIANSIDRIVKSIRVLNAESRIAIPGQKDQFKAERIKKFNDAMNDLSKKGPVWAQIADMLKKIAKATNSIPNKKEITIVVNYVFGKRPKGDASHQPEGFSIGLRGGPTKKDKTKDTTKPVPPHDFILPLDVQLALAKASSESSKKQIEADKAALAYVKKQIASGHLTKKGLVDAYNEIASLEGDIKNLTKAKTASGSKLSSILPSRFTSQIQKAIAAVSTADASGIPAQQINAMEKLEKVYEKALMFLKAEHETGAKRLLQIKEEASLTGKIADVRKSIGAIISQAVDAARQSLGQLFQGPVIAPTQAQQNAMLGVPAISSQTLTKDLRAQTSQFARFEKDLQKLRHRGASKELITELQAQGPNALPQIEALLKGSKANLEQFLKAFAAREKLVRQVAKVELKAAIVNLHAAHLNVVNARHSNPSSVRHHRHPRHTTVPHLAEGGIVDKATLALIGEKGREAVIPLPKNMRLPFGGGGDAVVSLLTQIEHTLQRILASLGKGVTGDTGGYGGTISAGRGAPKVQATFLGPHRMEPMALGGRQEEGGYRKLIINLDGREVGRGVLPHHQRQAKAGAAQVRGRHYGHNLALT